MNIARKAKTKESICMNKRGREKDHRRDGLPAEGYDERKRERERESTCRHREHMQT
jgi:hypothetical protein